MTMLTKKSLFLVKEEATYGTDPTPVVATNSILAMDVDLKEITPPTERNVQMMYLGTKKSISGLKHVELTFKIEVMGSGSAGTAPRLGDLLESCGMDETIAGGASATYEAVSSGHKSCTIYVFKDGRHYVISGCMGTFKLSCIAGNQAILEFTMKGLYADPTNVALSAPTYESTIPPVCKATTFTFDSKTTLIVSQLEIDMGNVVAMRESLAGTEGIAGFTVTERKPVMTLNPEAQIQTSYDYRGDRLTTEFAVSYVIGGTAGNICTVTVPKYNITGIEYADDEGILIEQLTGDCDISSGDDDVKLAFT